MEYSDKKKYNIYKSIPITIPKQNGIYINNIDNNNICNSNNIDNVDNQQDTNNENNNNIQMYFLKCSHFNPDKASPPNSWKSRLKHRLEKYGS
tara:strand:+ start:3340 stop:3618 length:279 start_codon:yes stop_codon:yes gene_type:complete